MENFNTRIVALKNLKKSSPMKKISHCKRKKRGGGKGGERGGERGGGGGKGGGGGRGGGGGGGGGKGGGRGGGGGGKGGERGGGGGRRFKPGRLKTRLFLHLLPVV